VEKADGLRKALPFLVEMFCVGQGDKSVQLLNRNIPCYLDLFSSRQLVFLNEAIRLLPELDSPIRLNLALLLSTSLEFNSMLCGYKGAGTNRAGAVRHTFSHHGYSFPYTALENNPLYPRRASGTLQKLFHSRVVHGRQWSERPVERDLRSKKPRFVPIAGERDVGTEVKSASALLDSGRRYLLRQGSAVSLPVKSGSIDAVVTDPPYYDTIQYGDLSAFFRVWLQHFLPDGAVWDYDQSTAAVSSERGGTRGRYIQLMSTIFRECRRVVRPETGRLIFTFHHWQAGAWSALSIALHNAGFRLLNRYVVHAEHPMSVHISKMRALTHDAILVLATGKGGTDSGWEYPRQISNDDGFRFTEACGSLLGWILDQPALTHRQIDDIWTEVLSSPLLSRQVKQIPD
jgi:putative DNA methylase